MIIYDMNHHIIYIYGYPYVGTCIWHMYNVHIMYEYVNFFVVVLCNNKTHRTALKKICGRRFNNVKVDYNIIFF